MKYSIAGLIMSLYPSGMKLPRRLRIITAYSPSAFVGHTAIAFVIGISTACTLVPQRPADRIASDVIAAIDAGRTDEAERLFEIGAKTSDARQKMYPVLFGAGTERYQQGDFAGATELLRFTAAHYQEAVAVREALLYSLFLQRSGTKEPDVTVTRQIEQALKDLRGRQATLPLWVDLVQAQLLIDQRRPDQARQAFDRFRSNWDGRPEALTVYVEDLGRYFQIN